VTDTECSTTRYSVCATFVLLKKTQKQTVFYVNLRDFNQGEAEKIESKIFKLELDNVVIE